METNEKNLTTGQTIAKEVIGEVGGITAGALVGGIAMTVVEATTCGKALKLLMKFGAYSINVATMFATRKAMKEWSEDMFDAYNGLKAMWKGRKKEPKYTEVEVEVS